MMTEKELQEKRRKKTDRFVLVLFLVLIAIPVLLYLLARDSPDRINRLYFAGYVLMAAAIFYSAQAIRRSLAYQKAPILESMLARSQTSAVYPQDYLDLTEQIKRSLQSRRYFRRSLARRLILLLRSQEIAADDPNILAMRALLQEPEPTEEKEPAAQGLWNSLAGLLNRIADYWDKLTGQGMPARELQNIISSLKEL